MGALDSFPEFANRDIPREYNGGATWKKKVADPV
jgi:hypothetical protein